MLLIEGPDMVGKTHFAHAVVDKLRELGQPAAYMKFGMESRGRMSWPYLRHRICPWTVCDRMHWSESIYAVATGKMPSLTKEEFMRVDRQLEFVGGMVVLITADVNSYPTLIDKFHS